MSNATCVNQPLSKRCHYSVVIKIYNDIFKNNAESPDVKDTGVRKFDAATFQKCSTLVTLRGMYFLHKIIGTYIKGFPMISVPSIQCDQIGQFLKVLGDKFSHKVAQMNGDIFGYCEKYHFSSKSYCS